VQSTESGNLADLFARKDLKEYADWLAAARRGDDAVTARLAEVDRWTDATLDVWYGKTPKKEPHFAEALQAAREMTPDAPTKLRALLADRSQPEVARATAALELAGYVEPNNEATQALRKALADRDPQIRAAAVLGLQQDAGTETVSALAPLLKDRTRLLRTETARSLALMGSDQLRGDERADFRNAMDECFETIKVDNDRAAGHMSIAILNEALGNFDEAEAAYQTAIRVESGSIGARTNLAALYDRQVQEVQQRATQLAQQGDRAGAERQISAVIQLPGKIARLRAEELGLLERDVVLAPDNAQLQGRIGLARYLSGWAREADAALLAASLLEPSNPEHLFRLAIYYRDTGRAAQAAPLVQRLLELRPGSRMFQQFAEELREPAGSSVPGPPRTP